MAANEEQRRRMLAMLLRIPPKNALQRQPAPPTSNWLSKPLPMEGRFNMLPIREQVPGMGPSLFNKRELALPGLLAGAVNAVTAPGRAAGGLLADPKAEAANFAGTFMGGGLLASRAAPLPTGSIGMNAAARPKMVRNSKGESVQAPREFFRGEKPGGARVQVGTSWDNALFAADSPDVAKWYGPNVTRITAKPEAKILYEGSQEFRSLMKGYEMRDKSLADWGTEASKRAREAGFDAVWFKRQSDLGTAILNRKAFDIHGELINK
jgi:hypothetical protein